MEVGFQVAYGKTLWVLYVCLVPPEVDPENGESEEISGIPKNVLDCHGGRRVTRRQPDLAIVCIQVRVHVMLSSMSCRPRSQSVSLPTTTERVSQASNQLAGVIGCRWKSMAPWLYP